MLALENPYHLVDLVSLHLHLGNLVGLAHLHLGNLVGLMLALEDL
jgi:hypothetical protein